MFIKALLINTPVLDVWLCRMPRWVEVHEIASGLNRRPAPEGGASAKAVPSSPSVSATHWTSFDSPSRSQLCASLGEDEAEDGQEDAAQRQCQQRLSLVRRPLPSLLNRVQTMRQAHLLDGVVPS